jgi:hypothetical protein
MAKQVWRFQCDVPYGETDPIVTVFLGSTEVDEDSEQTVVRQDTRNPVTMPLSEFAAMMAGSIKHDDIATAQATKRAAEKAEKQARADAEVAAKAQAEADALAQAAQPGLDKATPE